MYLFHWHKNCVLNMLPDLFCVDLKVLNFEELKQKLLSVNPSSRPCYVYVSYWDPQSKRTWKPHSMGTHKWQHNCEPNSACRCGVLCKQMFPPGIEPGNFPELGGCDIHYTTETHKSIPNGQIGARPVRKLAPTDGERSRHKDIRHKNRVQLGATGALTRLHFP